MTVLRAIGLALAWILGIGGAIVVIGMVIAAVEYVKDEWVPLIWWIIWFLIAWGALAFVFWASENLERAI